MKTCCKEMNPALRRGVVPPGTRLGARSVEARGDARSRAPTRCATKTRT